ncbi:class I SAM-dependent methyltransferase [Candidatus Peregrinibacteria bacterium]|nr:class I SAM-dependent methyltransferase [Candidatus Peregrinibacteria bacterium]
MNQDVIHDGEYYLHAGDKPYRDMMLFMRQYDMLRKAEILPVQKPDTPEAEIRGMQVQDVNASLTFERTRSQVRDALRAIIRHIFNQFGLPKNQGLDIGCGATGEMAEELLPGDIDKNSWVQIDVSPSAVQENQRRHPSSTIKEGSYLHMNGVQNLNIITGLSSLDATCFIDRAIEQIRFALKIGGYLLHVQDVRPGVGCGIREMEYMDLKPPYPIETATGKDEPLTYWIQHMQEYANVGELFRRQLGRAIEGCNGMELLFNKWISARKFLNSGPARWYFLNILLTAPYFPPEYLPVDDIFAIVTVARRAS